MEIKNWKMNYANHIGLDCTAPCSMYSVLLAHKLIPDPFYGINELELTELSEKGCSFSAEFEADEETLSKDYAELVFYGLDTICSIYLNEKKLDSVMNMHITYVYDVKKLLKTGRNTLRLDFSAPLPYFRDMNNRHFLYTNGDTIKGAAHLRKALYMSGWDWSPKLPDMGIFRPAALRAYNTDKIEDVYVSQRHSENEVTLDITVSTKHPADCDIIVSADGQTVKAHNGKCSITIKNPRLWWANGLGEQYLYEVKTELLKDGTVIDSDTKNIGLRTLTVSTAQDKYGNEFCFVLNGVKIFAMGANYVPQDNLLSRVTKENTEQLIKQCADAHFNAIRVWGGGVYPEDYFYDLCDKYGLLIWHDFMIACANVWLRKDFEQSMIAEAICNLKRMRHHASLALMCGNNEMEEAVLNWKGVGESALVRMDYLRLYEHILPDLCAEYAPDTFYLPSSPTSGGGFDDPDCESRGDVHYWAVWHGGIPFTEYRKHSFRFCSEYGFESYPSMKTIKSFCGESDMNCFSRVMENHQKCKPGNMKILMYLADNYLYPSKFENLVYASQLLQAEAIKYGVEHFRRIRGICMGSIYWQLNDSWPVASWSSIDYYGRPKALHYAAAKFYAPVAAALFDEDGKITVNIANETRTDFTGKIHLALCRQDFSEIQAFDITAETAALSSKDIFTAEFDAEDEYSSFVYADLYDKDGSFMMRQTLLFVKPKHFNWQKPEITAEFTDTQSGVIIDVRSDCFAKGVCIDFDETDCVLSDNFFDITSSAPYRIYAKGNFNAEQLKNHLIIKSVYDIR